MAFLDEVEKEPELHGKFIIPIDSLGNLASSKEIADAEANKGAMDMGLRAKQLKSMMRIITYKAAVTGTTIICSNHTYADPGALHPTLVKQQAGGSGPMYMASLLVQMAAKKERTDASNDSDEALTESRNYSGVTLRMLTVKNRFIPAFLQAEAYLNFKTGLDKSRKEMSKNLYVRKHYFGASSQARGYQKKLKDITKAYMHKKANPKIQTHSEGGEIVFGKNVDKDLL